MGKFIKKKFNNGNKERKIKNSKDTNNFRKTMNSKQRHFIKQVKPAKESFNQSKWNKYKCNRNFANSKKEFEENPLIEDNLVVVPDTETTMLVENLNKFNGVDHSDDDMPNIRKLIQSQNRKMQKSGGFQVMGLSRNVFNGIMKKGYKVPTPIQRRAIPPILDGRDVVAMARTGSGKTAAFLIPMFEKLKTSSAKSGARALILSPTRELALQTLQFTKEIGKYTGLKAAVILGGDNLENQFSAIHQNPDIIIATPGRFTHICVEMELKLNCIEYVVFDEADRLFEMGFAEHLKEILARLPENRQTLLFSATLPGLLVDFAKAGLSDPLLLRLDLDTKLSEHLKMTFLQCKSEEKISVLLYLLTEFVEPFQQCVIFTATRHHVDYLTALLKEAKFNVSYTYSSLDSTARKIEVGKFRMRKTNILVVTDLAARGIDIPSLDHVINFNFPAKSKLFLHRVGRVARAGRSGWAHSLISNDEMPYVLDLHMFLGRPVHLADNEKPIVTNDSIIGTVPQKIIDEQDQKLQHLNKIYDIESFKLIANNAHKQYIRSRPAPSAESIKRIKKIQDILADLHPIFCKDETPEEKDQLKLIAKVKNYKPQITIFELNKSKNSLAVNTMKNKRDKHKKVIKTTAKNISSINLAKSDRLNNGNSNYDNKQLETDNSSIVNSEKGITRKHFGYVKKDIENFVPYQPKDFETEKGLGLDLKSSFEREASNAILDIAGDEDKLVRKLNHSKTWDRKRKKFVGESNNTKRIKTESGQWISSSFKSKAYEKWLDKTKISKQEPKNDDDDISPKKMKNRNRLTILGIQKKYKKGFHKESSTQSTKNELRTRDEIIKQRRKKSVVRNKMKHRSKINQSKKHKH